MRFVIVLAAKRVVLGCFCAAALVAAGCADGRGLPTSPSATAAGSDLASTSSPRRGALRVTKECSQYTGEVGSFCTITSSSLDAIEVGSRVTYASAAGPGSLDSDIVLDLPGPGNNKAVGHCALDFATGQGLCTFSGGTGKFTHFQASVAVSYLGGPSWAWDGTYSFNSR